MGELDNFSIKTKTASVGYIIPSYDLTVHEILYPR